MLTHIWPCMAVQLGCGWQHVRSTYACMLQAVSSAIRQGRGSLQWQYLCWHGTACVWLHLSAAHTLYALLTGGRAVWGSVNPLCSLCAVLCVVYVVISTPVCGVLHPCAIMILAWHGLGEQKGLSAQLCVVWRACASQGAYCAYVCLLSSQHAHSMRWCVCAVFA